MSFVYWARLPEHTDIFTQGYVGITSATISHRYGQHKSNAKTNQNKSMIFEAAIRKYAEKIIIAPVIVASHDYCLEIEKKLRPTGGIGWNAGPGGYSPALGVPKSAELRAKWSAQRKGRKMSEEAKANIRAALRTPEARAKVGSASRGRKWTPEAIQKRTESTKGAKRSAETRAKMSESAKRRWAERKGLKRPGQTDD